MEWIVIEKYSPIQSVFGYARHRVEKKVLFMYARVRVGTHH